MRGRGIVVLAVAIAGLVLLPGSSRAEHRAALLIGNSAYPGAELDPAGRDIKALAGALRARGVRVSVVQDLKREGAMEVVKRFARTVPNRGTAIVYFSGYALRGRRGEVVLLPVDGKATDANAVSSVRFGVASVLGELVENSGSANNLLLVDGCYRHPVQKDDYDGAVQALETFPAESMVVYSAKFGEAVEPVADEPARIASSVVAGLAGGKSLRDLLHGWDGGKQSSLADGALSGEIQPPRFPPDQLGDGKRAGEEWINPVGGVFCWCPPGLARIGSEVGKGAGQADEGRVDVRIGRGFWISKYEFTRREARTLTGRHTYLSTGDHKLQPLNKFRKDEPGKMLDALNQGAPPGWEYALPTEAEWEYAVRAGTRTAYWFGDDAAALGDHGNFADRTLRESDFVGEFPENWKDQLGDGGYFTYAHRVWTDGHVRMSRVGEFPPNPWGLHGVCGNLAELTSTPYHPERQPAEKFDDLSGWVCKGGSWLSTADYCRSAFRGRFSFRSRENTTPNYLGLRLVLRRKAG